MAILNDVPPANWIRIFAQQPVRAFVPGAEPPNWKFTEMEATVTVNPKRLEGEARQVLNHFDSYVENANVSYSQYLEAVVRQNEEAANLAVREKIADEERRLRILANLGM
jgi:hypothetical protein